MFSPIVHSAPLELFYEVDLPHEEWMRRNLPFMEIATRAITLTLDGWKESKGVQWEIKWFKERGIPNHQYSLERLMELHEEAESGVGVRELVI